MEMTPPQLPDLLAERYSPRAFDSDRPVEREKLVALFEAARWAPSSMNRQPWRFIVATKDNPEAYDKLYNVLKSGNQRWAGNAPVLILAITERLTERGENKNARHDLGQAVAHLTVQATAMGLGLRQMGGILADEARAAYGIPDDYDVLNAIALGYPADPDTLPDDLAARERKPRTRNPLSAFVFDAWEKPSSLVDES